MLNLSRRGFLVGFAALSATAAVAKVGIPFKALPVLYGDGKHDDSDGLEAALNGRPFMQDGVGYVAETDAALVEDGEFFISRTIVIDAPTKFVRLNRCNVMMDALGTPFFTFTALSSGYITNNVFTHTGAFRHKEIVGALRFGAMA